AIAQPAMVRTLAVIGTSYEKRGEIDEVVDWFEQHGPETWPAMVRDIYAQTAVQPDRFSIVAGKLTALWRGFRGFATSDLTGIRAPTLVVIGDHDSVRPEHAMQLARIIPAASLAILPQTDHFAPISPAAW